MNKEFYDKCADIMGTTHDYRTPVPRRTRWNNRLLGNGRFPNRGVIRPFGDKCIHVMLTNPRVCQTFDSPEQLFDFLKGLDYD